MLGCYGQKTCTTELSARRRAFNGSTYTLAVGGEGIGHAGH